jgi:hypothetical protein
VPQRGPGCRASEEAPPLHAVPRAANGGAPHSERLRRGTRFEDEDEDDDDDADDDDDENEDEDEGEEPAPT